MSDNKWDEFFYYDLVYYDPTIPECLRRKKSGGNGKFKVGSPVGTKSTRYYQCKLAGNSFMNHRIVWTLFYGEIPEGKIIDHVDGDTFNNKIENLRLCDMKTNKRNQKKVKTNTSGVTGVQYEKDSRWRAVWVDNDGNTGSKSFSILKFGNRLAFEMACSYRDTMIVELNNKGAGYTERHGK